MSPEVQSAISSGPKSLSPPGRAPSLSGRRQACADFLIERFLVHHVIDLAVQADERAELPSN